VRSLQCERLEDYFAITCGLKPHAGLLQARPNGLVIVDFSVVDNPNSGSTIPHRLVAACQIDNAEPAHAEGEVFSHPGTFVIRSTMRDSNIHRVDCSQQLLSSEMASYADNTAHKVFSLGRLESICDRNTITYTRGPRLSIADAL